MTVADKSVLLISSDRSVNDAIGSALSGLKGLHLQTEPSTLAGLNGKAVQLAKGRDVIIFESIVMGLATAPPYTPLCKSRLGPVTSTSI